MPEELTPEEEYLSTHNYIEGFGYFEPQVGLEGPPAMSTNLMEILDPLLDSVDSIGGVGYSSMQGKRHALYDDYGAYFAPYDPFKENMAKSAAELAKEDIINQEMGGIEALRRSSNTGMRSGGTSGKFNTYLDLTENAMLSEDISEASVRFGARKAYREDVYDRWSDLVNMKVFDEAVTVIPPEVPELGDIITDPLGDFGAWFALNTMGEEAWESIGENVEEETEHWSEEFVDNTGGYGSGPGSGGDGSVESSIGQIIADAGDTMWNSTIGKNGIGGWIGDGLEDVGDAIEDSCVLSTAAYKQGLINSDDLMKFVSWRLKTQSKEFLGNVKWLGYQIAFRPVSNMMLKSKWFAKIIKKLILNKWMEIIEGKKKNRITKFVVEYTGVLGYLFNYKKAIELGKRIKPKGILKAYKNTIIKYDGNDKAFKRFLKGLKNG